jgi:AraC-like DNA-binding protein
MRHLHCFAALDANVSTSAKWRIFANQSHFSASYKMRYGVTPTQSAAQNEI